MLSSFCVLYRRVPDGAPRMTLDELAEVRRVETIKKNARDRYSNDGHDRRRSSPGPWKRPFNNPRRSEGWGEDRFRSDASFDRNNERSNDRSHKQSPDRYDRRNSSEGIFKRKSTRDISR